MIKIELHGTLKTLCAKPIEVAVDTVHHAISYLLRAFPPLRAMLKAGVFRVSLENEHANSMLSSHSNFNCSLEGVQCLHLVPLEGVASRKAMAIIGIVVGVVLIATGVFAIAGVGALAAAGAAGAVTVGTVSLGITASALILGGAGLALGGITAMASMRGLGDLGTADKSDDRQSTLFSSVSNRTAKGVALPICYGRFLCGSNVVSQSIRTVEVLG